MQTLARRIRHFVFRGVVMGAVLSMPFIPVLLLTGNRPLPRFGVGALSIMAVYLLAGAVGGFLFALAYPLRRSFWGGFLLGALALCPAYLGFAWIFGRGTTPLLGNIAIGLLLGILVGGGVWVWEWAETDQATAPPRRSLIALMWIGVALCMIAGSVLGARWPGQWPATVGLALVFLPLLCAVVATFSWYHREEPSSIVASIKRLTPPPNTRLDLPGAQETTTRSKANAGAQLRK